VISAVVAVALAVGAGGAGYAYGRLSQHMPRHRVGRSRDQGAPSREQILTRLNGLDHRFDDLERRMVEVERSVARAATEIRLAVAQRVAPGPPDSGHGQGRTP
jgi:hypothetical protein